VNVMDDKRVAIQLVSTGGIYGAERSLLELASYLRARGWQSHVVALEGAGATDLVERAAGLDLASEAFVPTGRLAFLPMALRLRRLLRTHPRAVVHSHGYKPDILLRLLGAHHQHGCLATCHNWYSETWRLRAFERMAKRCVRAFDHVVGVSSEIVSALLTSGVPRQKVSLIHNGISALKAPADARAQVRSELRVPPETRLIVQIGRLARPKRIDLLLKAVADLAPTTPVHVLLAGEGDQAAPLADLVRQLHLEASVHFCGYRSDTARLLAAADLLVLSSDSEGLPIVILEAMAVQCPIVATGVGELSKVLTHGQDAWLVPKNDVMALSAAIRERFDHQEVATRRAASAYAKFLRQYSQESMGAAYLQIYNAAWERHG
jgi:L-malate glycosyltransferase